MSTNLDAFLKLVRASHDATGMTCHWTSFDEIALLTAVSNIKGPCPCPAAPAPPPCPHDGVKCMNTAAVLALKGANEPAEITQLGAIEADLKPIQDVIDLGQQILDSYVQHRDANQSEDDATKEALVGSKTAHPLKSVMGQHWEPAMRTHVTNILALKLPKKLSTKASEGNPCVCLTNKVARLESEKKTYAGLRDAATKASKALQPLVQASVPTFSNTLLPVLTGSVKVVAGFMSGNAKQAGDGVSDLLKYLDQDCYAGGKIFLLLKAVESVAYQKIGALVCAIYHDKQAEAVTCRPAT